MKRIDAITLDTLLPDVFRETKPESEIWLSQLTLLRGERYLIHAESGTGKSSLCSYLYGNRADYSGTILFDGEDSRNFSIARWCEIRQRSLALLPQEMRLFPELTAMENIDLKNRLTGHKTEGEIIEMLRRLEIADKAHTPVKRLSIGQQQRVAVARALCQPFDFLHLDEPVSHLDPEANRAVASLVERTASALGAGVIATSVGNPLCLSFTSHLKL